MTDHKVKFVAPKTKTGAPKVQTVKHRKISVKQIRQQDALSVRKLMAVQAAKPELKTSEGKDGTMVSLVKGVSETKEFARTLLGNRPVMTTLIQDFTATGIISGAGAALANSTPADVVLTQGFSSWFNLFDEMRCHTAKAMFWIAIGSAATTDQSNGAWAANWDPMQSAAPGSVASVLTASRHLGPSFFHGFTGSNIALNNTSCGLIPVTKNGHFELSSGKLTESMLPVNSGGVQAVNPVGGDWVSTSDATAVVGYFKFYGEGLGSTSVIVVRLFIEYQMEFRFRG